MLHNDTDYMKLALKEAQKAYELGEVPIGAILVYQDKVLARAHNLRETKQLTSAHAEMLVLEKASKKLHSWRLEECTVYVTVEPCFMCMSAMIQSRIKRVVYGTKEPKMGACGSVMDLNSFKFNHTVEITGGVLEAESKALLQDFFAKRRKENKENHSL